MTERDGEIDLMDCAPGISTPSSMLQWQYPDFGSQDK